MLKTVHYSLLVLLSFNGLCVAAPQPCGSSQQCNQVGTAAYQAGQYSVAIDSFERQLRSAETAEDTVQREVALNNLMLATLKAGKPGMARAWLAVALQVDQLGPATRHNMARIGAVDMPALAATPEGLYLRYAGQAAWSSLEIKRGVAGSYHAEFSPIRMGRGSLEEWGPAAIGELAGELNGVGAYFSLQSAGLGQACAVDLLRDGVQLQVLEVFAEGCQDYGGANISVAGRYYKVEP
jgi:hypothetical protein